MKVADYQRIVRIGLSDAEKRAHAIRLNINRRHLNRGQRDELIKTLAEFVDTDGSASYSTREIAAMVGVTQPTIVNVINSTDKNLSVDRSSVVRGKDRKVRDAKKPKPAAVNAKNGKEQERAQQAQGLVIRAEAIGRLGSDECRNCLRYRIKHNTVPKTAALTRKSPAVLAGLRGGLLGGASVELV